ncbi:MAG: DNA polymerase III subunit delta' [Parcubacteria group bacterium Athens0714_16]|nr:MAG: DNA polymerase III subunit delta' [Parcubacteria group bacterium Athens0714_16]
MKEIQDIYRKNKSLHHAYLIEGDSDVVVGQICKFIEVDLNFKIQGNPDFWNEKYGSFGIDEARKIKDIQTRKSFGDKKIFILSCNSMTTEAQNSLLKLFEEPTAGTHFFIVADSSEIFLPTLKSRMLIIKNTNQDKNETNDLELVEKFLNTKKAGRLKLLKGITEDKDKEKAISFLNNLEVILREKIDFSSKEQAETLEEIIKCRDYLNDRAPSVKLLLEHIALITPETIDKR